MLKFREISIWQLVSRGDQYLLIIGVTRLGPTMPPDLLVRWCVVSIQYSAILVSYNKTLSAINATARLSSLIDTQHREIAKPGNCVIGFSMFIQFLSIRGEVRN